ncbi:hypothetical protein NUW58_g5360 [Xylaria curta]|uniref:Uncharacterized protein n=1 Tax=Xylaria curta TaxID=42375 RepID=A0ACC1P2G3_9PEZI|nr:hypothetical protein NUW58_g5360 [Xylaria curta]
MSNADSTHLQALLDGPALAPPPGVIPQLDNPPSYRTATTVIPIVAITVTTLSLAMRTYTKVSILRKVDLGDYSLFLAWGIYVGLIAVAIVGCDFAPGVHQWDLRLRDLISFLYYFHVASILYGICIFFIKLSILFQYIQIFMPTREPKAMYWFTIFLIVANFVFYLASTFLEIWACNPIEKAWNPLITTGYCIDVMELNVIASSVNTASDLIILVLPQLVIWRLVMSFQTKLAVSAIFLVATFACAASAVRLYYAVELRDHHDVSYYAWYAGIWTLPEMGCGILVAALPVAGSFSRHLKQSKLFSSIASSFRGFTSRRELVVEQSNSADVDKEVPNVYWRRQSKRPAWMGTIGSTFSQLDSGSVTGLRPGRRTGTSLEEGSTGQPDIYSGDDWELSTRPGPRALGLE